MARAEFGLYTSDDGACITVLVSGEIDITNADELAETLTHATSGAPVDLVVDLAGVTFFGSAGVRCLVQVNSWARDAGVSFRVARPSAIVERVVELTGVGQVLHVEP